MIKLSKRLQAVADLIPKCDSLADICSDHAYLPIYCVINEICKNAIAGDIAEGPCEQGLRQVEKYDLADKISVRCGSGLTVIDQHEVTGIAIAGVGGTTIIDILEEGKEVAKSLDFLVVQPQSGFSALRKYLMNSNYKICDENLVEENGIIYQVMLVKKGDMEIKSYLQFEYGSINLKKKTKELHNMLNQEIKHLNVIKRQLNSANNDLTVKKIELNEKIKLIENALKDLN